jgi:hypothetical protein
MEKICRRAKGPICRPIRVPPAIPIMYIKTNDAVLFGLSIQSKNKIIEQIEIPKDCDITKLMVKDFLKTVMVRTAAIKVAMIMV